MSYLVWALVAVLAAALFLALRNSRRQQRQTPAATAGSLRAAAAQAAADVQIPIPDSVRKAFMFWGGGLAGVVSAAVTHQLDVLKTRRHVGLAAPATLSDYFYGMAMGSFAQGQRFAVTLVINATLQAKLDAYEKKAAKKGGRCGWLVSFMLSMVASGAGEFLSNPPVVIKNYQISHECSAVTACEELFDAGGVPRFFSGVGFAVLRKSLANAVVLQTVGPTKTVLTGLFPVTLGSSAPQAKTALGFVAGSITGSIAEVMTNHPDQVKTLTQSQGLGVWEAVLIASKNPFRGAGFAALRKGAIRGINWGGLALFMAVAEGMYRARVKKAISDNADPEYGTQHGA